MKLPKICIERPVFAFVLNVVLVVIGLMAYKELATNYFPNLPNTQAQVDITYPGASADLMERQVTKVVENLVSSLDDVESYTSSSWYQHSRTVINFKLTNNLEQDFAKLRDNMANITTQLPDDIAPPSISTERNADLALLISFTSNKDRDQAQLREYVERYVIRNLKQVDGVGSVSLQGASSYALRIWLDASKMAALKITPGDVYTLLKENNINFPAGVIKGANRDFSIVANTQLQTVKDFKDQIVKVTDQGVIQLKNIATVKLGAKDIQQTPLRINNKQGVLIQVKPRYDANPINVGNKVAAFIKQLQTKVPKDITVKVDYNSAIFLQKAVTETAWTIIEAVFLVILVVYLFLGSLRATFIPIITIPVCLFAGGAVMAFFDFSINIFTLLALVLAIGLVVDDAIVMLENIYRYIEEGLSPREAAIKGSQQIAFAVVAMTLTLAIVYVPIGFAQGFTAQLFKQFAFTLAGAVLISGFVALTLTPMMCSKILKTKGSAIGVNKFEAKIFNKIESGYSIILKRVLNIRPIILLILIIIGVAGSFIYVALPKILLPTEDTGYLTIDITGPANSSLDYIDKNLKKVEEVLAKKADVKTFVAFSQSASGECLVILKPWEERKISTKKLIQKLQQQLNEIPQINASVSQKNFGDSGDGANNQASVYLQGLGSYLDLYHGVNYLISALKKTNELNTITTNLKFDEQQYDISINRNEISRLGISLQEIANTLSIFLSGKSVTNIDSGAESYQVKLQIPLEDLGNTDVLQKINVRDANGEMIPLSSLVTLTPSSSISSFQHYDGLRAAFISASILPGTSLAEVINIINKVAVNLPKGQQIKFSGLLQQYLSSSGDMRYLFMLAVLFIFLVLSAQFESFVDPFIILLTVPLCIVGALFTLYIAGGSLNIFSEIGLMTLVGLITKHGILMTEFSNELRIKKQLNAKEAVLEAAQIRLRPILMTTMAMVLGALPLAYASGPGSVSRNQIGFVIVGGLLFGTFFSLIVVPIAYSYLGVFKKIPVSPIK